MIPSLKAKTKVQFRSGREWTFQSARVTSIKNRVGIYNVVFAMEDATRVSFDGFLEDGTHSVFHQFDIVQVFIPLCKVQTDSKKEN